MFLIMPDRGGPLHVIPARDNEKMSVPPEEEDMTLDILIYSATKLPHLKGPSSSGSAYGYQLKQHRWAQAQSRVGPD